MLVTLTVALLVACFIRGDDHSGIAGLFGLFMFFGSGASLGYDLGRSRNAAAAGTLWSIWIWWMSLVVYYFFNPPLQ